MGVGRGTKGDHRIRDPVSDPVREDIGRGALQSLAFRDGAIGPSTVTNQIGSRSAPLTASERRLRSRSRSFVFARWPASIALAFFARRASSASSFSWASSALVVSGPIRR